MTKIKCPKCEAIHTIVEWNDKTKRYFDTEDIIELTENGCVCGCIYTCPSCELEIDEEEIQYKNKIAEPLQDKIDESIKLLRENDYVVRKLTEQQEDDLEKCEISDGSKDCSTCSCNCCLFD